uniref:FAR1 domain-containing protein n=1 Tax=Amphimedon queenslandica TaxID=400682 RepID=A0A1X7UN18_AMPQE
MLPGNGTVGQNFLFQAKRPYFPSNITIVLFITMATCSSVSNSMSSTSQDKSDLNLVFTVGETFLSFIELEKKVSYIKKRILRSSGKEKLAAARKRVERPLNKKDLRTFKQDCPVSISLKVNKNGKNLIVTGLILEHSHVLSQNLHKHLRQKRKLSEVVKENKLLLLHIKANKKLVQEELCQKTGLD